MTCSMSRQTFQVCSNGRSIEGFFNNFSIAILIPYIFLIIILEFHALIPYRLEENIKNMPSLFEHSGNHHIKL